MSGEITALEIEMNNIHCWTWLY